jgi:1-deoxyxylulose-5-phosphate synthase
MRKGATPWACPARPSWPRCDAQPRRLGTDYIDLYQIHRWDPHTPIEETLEALDDLVRPARSATSAPPSMWAWQFAKALFTADQLGYSRFVSMQNHYNLIHREEEREMLPLCRGPGHRLIPWSPLARGYLARTRDTIRDTVRAGSDEFATVLYKRDADLTIVDRNAEVAARLGVKPAQTALAWMLGKPGVVAPIIGASKPQHLQDAIDALNVSLTEEDVKALEELYEPHPVLGHG